MIVCPRCQTTHDDGTNYCGHCGWDMLDLLDDLPDDHAILDDPLIGQIIANRYSVLSRIGEGGMGVVYKVEHIHMSKIMAMKVLHRELVGNREVVKRFRREAQAISRLNHSNIVSVFDFGRVEDTHYLVMEYIRGEDLLNVVERHGPLTFPRAGDIVIKVCEALHEAHGKGIIHRDIKPENILILTPREGVDLIKVLDFGLAKLQEREDLNTLTSRGSLLGTPYYMAPEQIRGEDLDCRTDIYSLGAVMYRLLSGVPPFQAKSPVGVLTKHLTDDLVPLTKRCPDLFLPQEADQIVMKAMDKEPAQRYQSVMEMAEDIQAALERFQQRLLISSIPDPNAELDLAPPEPCAPPAKEPLPAATEGLFDGEEDFTAVGPNQTARISTREDWDHYEARLRRRRRLKFVFPLAMVALLSAGAYWGFVLGHLAPLLQKDTEEEPNNSPAQANRLLLGSPMRGTIGAPLSENRPDADWYSITKTSSQAKELRVEVSQVPPDIDVKLEIYQPGREYRLAYANDSGLGGREVIPNVLFQGREAYVVVSGVWVQGRKANFNELQSYMIQASVKDILPGAEHESNDGFDQAGEILLGREALGMLGGSEDRDFYRLSQVPEGVKALEAEASGLPGVNMVLKVYNVHGRAFMERDAGGLGEGERLEAVEVKAALLPYYFVVERSEGANYDMVYRLVVRGR